jgi:polyferredoxin
MKIRSKRQRIRWVILMSTMLLFPVLLNYLSPYVIIIGASEGVVNGSMLLFGGLLLSALALGRGWCAWVCPAAGIGEMCAIAQPKTVGRKPRRIKWGVWVVWLVVIAAFALAAGGYQRVDPLFLTEEFVSVTHPQQYIIYYFVLISIVVLSLTVGKRGFCHTVCWMAPFMILGRNLSNILRSPALRLCADAQACMDCEVCTRNCPMSLDVHAMVKLENMEHMDCILCGQCVDGCTKKVIRYTFAKPQQ